MDGVQGMMGVWVLVHHTYMFEALRHGVCVGIAQGEVEHHNLVGCDQSRHRHDEDQVPEGDIKGLSIA